MAWTVDLVALGGAVAVLVAVRDRWSLAYARTDLVFAWFVVVAALVVVAASALGRRPPRALGAGLVALAFVVPAMAVLDLSASVRVAALAMGSTLPLAAANFTSGIIRLSARRVTVVLVVATALDVAARMSAARSELASRLASTWRRARRGSCGCSRRARVVRRGRWSDRRGALASACCSGQRGASGDGRRGRRDPLAGRARYEHRCKRCRCCARDSGARAGVLPRRSPRRAHLANSAARPDAGIRPVSRNRARRRRRTLAASHGGSVGAARLPGRLRYLHRRPRRPDRACPSSCDDDPRARNAGRSPCSNTRHPRHRSSRPP